MTDEKTIFYVFKNTKKASLHALTHDKEGSDLPQDQGKWVYWKEFEGGVAGRIAFGLEDEKAAHAGIEKDGYYIWQWPRMLKAGT